jgi:hypothetical protein
VSGRRTAPPSGFAPPEEAVLGGVAILLGPLCEEIAERYFERFPEDLERYGDAGRQWEIHDTQHLLNWAIGDVEGFVDLDKQAAWLARILAARDFPLEHLAVNLELAADVVDAQVADGSAVAEKLRGAAATVRAH